MAAVVVEDDSQRLERCEALLPAFIWHVATRSGQLESKYQLGWVPWDYWQLGNIRLYVLATRGLHSL